MTQKSTEDPNKPKFLEIKDVAMMRRVFSALVRHKVRVTMWLKNQPLRFETIFVEYIAEGKILAADYPAVVGEEQVNAAFKAQGMNEILGSFQVDNVNFFFKTKYLEKDAKQRFVIEAPSQLYKLQRRANLRVPLNREVAPKLTLLDPSKPYSRNKAISDKDLLAYRLVDLSAGGVGIAVSPDEKEKFRKGTKLSDLRFKVREHQIVADGKVAYVSESKNDKNEPILKVGIQFSTLRPQYEQHIVQFVLEESRKFFSLLY